MSTPPRREILCILFTKNPIKHYVYNFISGWMNSKKEILAY